MTTLTPSSLGGRTTATAATPPAAGTTRQPSVAWRRRKGLSRKFALAFIGLVSLVVMVNGGIDMWLGYDEAKSAAADLQLQKARAAAERIGAFVGDIEQQIGWTTNAQWSAGTVDQRRYDFIRLLRQVPAITDLAELDGAGREQLKVSRLAVDVVGNGADYSADPRFQKAVADRVWFGPVYFRKESEPYMSISVAHVGARPGVTVADVNLKFIWDVVTALRVGQAGYAYVVDSRGRLIAHPDISLVLRGTDLSQLPQVASALAALRDPTTPDDDVAVARGAEGRSVLTAYAPIARLNWLVFVELPLREALAPVYASLARTAALLGLGLLLAAVAGTLLARRMTVPIRQLQSGAELLGSGALDHRIEIRTGDEIEALAERFNRMGAQLQDAYETLEAKVEARTRDLALASQHKSQFLANMSHELRTPLNAVLGYAELLVDGIYGELPEKARGVLERIQSNGKHLLRLINDVLDLSKIEAGQLTLTIDDYSMAAIAVSVVASAEPLARAKGLEFGATIADGMPLGRGDERRLTQVLLNLVGNAIKFTEEGSVELVAIATEDTFDVSVRDTGPGIAVTDHERIFEEFHQIDSTTTRTKGGTGLGLAISRRIAEMHNGRLTVEAALGAGSTFRLVVPVRVEEHKEAAQ